MLCRKYIAFNSLTFPLTQFPVQIYYSSSSSEKFQIYFGGSDAAVFSLMDQSSEPSDDPDPSDPFPGLIKGNLYTVTVCAYKSLPPNFQIAVGKCKSATTFAADISSPPLSLGTTPYFFQPLAVGLSWATPIDTGLGSVSTLAVLRYEVQLSTDPGFLSVMQNTTVMTTSAVISGQKRGATIYSRVRAVTLAGPGNFSSVCGPVTVCGLSAEPSNLSMVTGKDSSGLYVSATWSVPSDTGDLSNLAVLVASYAVDFSNSSDFSSGTVSFVTSSPQFDSRYSSPNTPTLRLLIQANQGNLIYCRVSARTVYGLGSASGTVSRTIAAPPGPPALLAFSASGPLRLNLSWAPPADKGAGVGKSYPLVQYRITLSRGSAIGPAVYDTVLVPPEATNAVFSSFQGSPLARGVVYTASIWSVNDVGASASASVAQQAAVGLSSAPAQVVLCAYDGGSSCSIGSGIVGSAGSSALGAAGPSSLW